MDWRVYFLDGNTRKLVPPTSTIFKGTEDELRGFFAAGKIYGRILLSLTPEYQELEEPKNPQYTLTYKNMRFEFDTGNFIRGMKTYYNFFNYNYIFGDITHNGKRIQVRFPNVTSLKYNEIIYEEDYMRNNMYQEGFENNPMNTDLYYNLIKVDEGMWDEIELEFPEDPNLLFIRDKVRYKVTKKEIEEGRESIYSGDSPKLYKRIYRSIVLEKQNWNNMMKKLEVFEPLFEIPGLMIAGGFIFSVLFDTPSNDIDFFITGVKEEDGEEAIRRFVDNINDKLNPIGLYGGKDYLQKTLNELNAKIKELSNKLTPFENEIKDLEQEIRTTEYTIFSMRFSYASERKRQLERELPVLRDKLDELIKRTYPEVSKLKKEISKFSKQRDKINKMFREFRNHKYVYERSTNSITIKNVYLSKDVTKDIQIILRLYKSYSEVLHGFDVDSCCMGYDGKNILLTKRCLFSLIKGYNTVNFDRMSPSYPYRLLKYGARGIAVKVPNFDRRFINTDLLREMFDDYIAMRVEKSGEWLEYYKFRKELKTLDLLIYFDFHWKELKHNDRIRKSFEIFANSFSDYESKAAINNRLENIGSLSSYVKNTDLYEGYKGYNEKYESIIKRLGKVYSDVSVNKIFTIYHGNVPVNIMKSENLNYLLHVPDDLYKGLSEMTTFTFSKDISFKVTKPGEQMTNTFTKLILEDPKKWYEGKLYLEKE